MGQQVAGEYWPGLARRVRILLAPCIMYSGNGQDSEAEE